MSKKPILRKSASVGFSVMAISMLAFSAQALPISNGSFENVNSPTGSSFLITANNTTEVTDWVTSSGVSFLLYPGTATTVVSGIALWPGCAAGSTLLNCINPAPFPSTSPDGGNFLAVDGDVPLSGTLTQTLSGLVPGQFYNVSFYQAAGQLKDFRNQNNLCCTGSTTEQWLVSLSDIPFGGISIETHLSALMLNDSQSFVGWQSQTLTFKATNAMEVLGFFALGTPSGVPPFVLLDGVTVTAAPEPGIYALLGIGLLSLLVARRQQGSAANRSLC